MLLFDKLEVGIHYGNCSEIGLMSGVFSKTVDHFYHPVNHFGPKVLRNLQSEEELRLSKK